MSAFVHPLVTTFNWPLLLVQGATYRTAWGWAVRDDAGVATPVDLTGCTALAGVWEAKDTTRLPLLTLSDVTGGIVLGGMAGTVNLLITDEQTLLLPPLGKGWWTLEIGWPDGDTTRLAEGVVRVTLRGLRGG